MGFKPWKVFLDTNVFIAGLLSASGASSAVLDLGEAEEILIVVSEQVLVELDRNMLSKFPMLVARYRSFIQNLEPLLADNPSPALVKKVHQWIPTDDAPIVAAAIHASADYLVSLDVRHFHTKALKAHVSIPIVTPSEFLHLFRQQFEEN